MFPGDEGDLRQLLARGAERVEVVLRVEGGHDRRRSTAEGCPPGEVVAAEPADADR